MSNLEIRMFKLSVSLREADTTFRLLHKDRNVLCNIFRTWLMGHWVEHCNFARLTHSEQDILGMIKHDEYFQTLGSTYTWDEIDAFDAGITATLEEFDISLTSVHKKPVG